MTPLRQQMITALQLSGTGERTQDAYVREVRLLAQFYHTSPDMISDAARVPKTGTSPCPQLRWPCSVPPGKPIGTRPGSVPPPGGITTTVLQRPLPCVGPVSRAPVVSPNDVPA